MPYVKRRSTRRPYRRYPRRRTRSRKVYPKRRTYRKARLTKWVNPVKTIGLYKFIYANSGFSITNDSGAVPPYVEYFSFKGNSPYDPNAAAGGKQPYGWDQYVGAAGNIFQKFMVFSSQLSIFATMIQPAESSVQSCTVTTFPYLYDTLSAGELTDIKRQPRAKSVCMNLTSKPTCVLKNYSPTSLLYPNTYKSDALLQGRYNSDPGYLWHWIVHLSSEREEEEVTIKFDVRIKYYCRLNRLTEMNES